MSEAPVKEKSNLHILGDYSTKMLAGDYEAVYQFFHDEFMSHVTDRVSPDASGSDVRSEEAKFWQQAQQAMPDMEMKLNLLIEKDDLVVSNWTIEGTHTGTAFYDVPANGEKRTINGTAILRFKDGKIVEHWGGPHCMKGVGLVNG